MEGGLYEADERFEEYGRDALDTLPWVHKPDPAANRGLRVSVQPVWAVS
jgi:hypothetical protein